MDTNSKMVEILRKNFREVIIWDSHFMFHRALKEICEDTCHKQK